jgi:putative ABC transport system ATP-binding protein
MIKVTNLKHHYDAAPPMDFKDWDINDSSRWLLTGNSGSGKTTLIHMLSGILRPVNGQVFINGTALYALKNKKLDQFRGQHIGLVFQRPHLIRSLSVQENLILAQHFAGLPTNNQRIAAVLESLGIGEKSRSLPDQLSHGQLQRASIARAVVNRPILLIADEPTSSLDDGNAKSALDLLCLQAKENTSTLIVATHDQRVKAEFTNIYDLS